METAFVAVKSVLVTAFAFLTTLAQIFAPVTAQIFKGEDSFFEDWSASDKFTRSYCIELAKNPNEEFKVLNLTDTQLSSLESYQENGEILKNTVDKLVKEFDPDLITMTGDNAWSMTAYEWIVALIDSYDIPWAPVMGNHDGQGCFNEFWCAYQFASAKNCLFKFGPKDMGYGNYIINVTENGKIIHTLFMMDTHSGCTDTEAGAINKGTSDGGYDHLWANQIDWYKWAVKGIAEIAGETIDSSVFFHIPVVETKTIYAQIYDKEKGEYIDEYKYGSYGSDNEGECPAPANNGFFETCVELGSTRNIIYGHDHVNDSSFMYKGIRLTYGVKTGAGCYWQEDKSGGTLLEIGSRGYARTTMIYINPDNFAVSKTVRLSNDN